MPMMKESLSQEQHKKKGPKNSSSHTSDAMRLVILIISLCGPACISAAPLLSARNALHKALEQVSQSALGELMCILKHSPCLMMPTVNPPCLVYATQHAFPQWFAPCSKFTFAPFSIPSSWGPVNRLASIQQLEQRRDGSCAALHDIRHGNTMSSVIACCISSPYKAETTPVKLH